MSIKHTSSDPTISRLSQIAFSSSRSSSVGFKARTDSQQALQKRLGKAVVRSMQQLAHDHTARVVDREVCIEDINDLKKGKEFSSYTDVHYKKTRGYRERPEVLEGGCYYPEEFFEALKEVGAEDRLELYRKKGGFFHGHAPEKYFKHTENLSPYHRSSPTGKITEVVIRKNVAPSKALDEIIKGPSIIDCNIACQIAQYQGIRKVIGDDKFNIIFKNRLMLGDYLAEHGKNPLMCFLKSVDHKNLLMKQIESVFKENMKKGLPKRDNLIPIGARVMFRNIEKYTSKHLLGDSAAFNMIHKGHERYLGLGFSKLGVTKEYIQKYFVESYNHSPSGSERLDRSLKKWYKTLDQMHSKLLKKDQISKVDLDRELVSGIPTHIKALDVNLIQKIIDTPVEKKETLKRLVFGFFD